MESTPGSGSTFWFTLAQPEADGLTEARGAAVSRQLPEDLTVLVVDDNPVNLRVATYMLENLGVKTQTASGGADAIAAALAGDFSCILMDCQMPGIDGLEATRRIRAKGRTMPIVALTASAFVEDREACQLAGMDDMLTKPVMPEDLSRVLLSFACAA